MYRLLHEPINLRLGVVRRNAEQDEESLFDSSHDFTLNVNPCTADPLQDSAHLDSSHAGEDDVRVKNITSIGDRQRNALLQG